MTRSQFEYQRAHRFFAAVSKGLEPEAAAEIQSLGGRSVKPTIRGLHFTASRAVLYRILYCTRLCSRILAPLSVFRATDADTLYRHTKALDWALFLSSSDTFAVRSTVASDKFPHSQYAALKVKDALVDRLRAQSGKRPDVDRKEPDVRIDLHISRDHRVTLSLDLAPIPLHRRGYRLNAVEAPMRETVAAAAVRMSGWDEQQPLTDPMCGSGTLLAEALMHWCRIPAGYLRSKMGAERLPDFDGNIWKDVKRKMDREIRPLPPGMITGADKDPAAVAAATENLARLPEGQGVKIECRDILDSPGYENTFILSNPPYGIRMGDTDQTGELMRSVGDFLKQKCRTSTACFYFGDRSMIKRIGLKPAWKKPLQHAELDGRLTSYPLY